MSEPSQPDINILEELHDLQAFFTAANAQLQAGRFVNMSGIDKRVSRVCQAAQQAPTQQQRAYLSELTILVDLLNTYERDMRALQASLQNQQPEPSDDGNSDA